MPLDRPSRVRISARASPQCGLKGGRSHCNTVQILQASVGCKKRKNESTRLPLSHKNGTFSDLPATLTSGLKKNHQTKTIVIFIRYQDISVFSFYALKLIGINYIMIYFYF